MVSRKFMEQHKKTAKGIIVLFTVGIFLLVVTLVTTLMQGKYIATGVFVVLSILCFWAFGVLIRDYLKMVK